MVYVSSNTIIGSDNGLLAFRYQSTIELIVTVSCIPIL